MRLLLLGLLALPLVTAPAALAAPDGDACPNGQGTMPHVHASPSKTYVYQADVGCIEPPRYVRIDVCFEGVVCVSLERYDDAPQEILQRLDAILP